MKRDYLVTVAQGLSTTNYVALLTVLLALPRSLSQEKFTNRQRNAIRKANILRRKLLNENGKKNLHKRPDKRP
jgi:hypothetical protein